MKAQDFIDKIARDQGIKASLNEVICNGIKLVAFNRQCLYVYDDRYGRLINSFNVTTYNSFEELEATIVDEITSFYSDMFVLAQKRATVFANNFPTLTGK